jgi:hypothetical protein
MKRSTPTTLSESAGYRPHKRAIVEDAIQVVTKSAYTVVGRSSIAALGYGYYLVICTDSLDSAIQEVLEVLGRNGITLAWHLSLCKVVG